MAGQDELVVIWRSTDWSMLSARWFVSGFPPLRPTDARFNTDQTEFGEL